MSTFVKFTESWKIIFLETKNNHMTACKMLVRKCLQLRGGRCAGSHESFKAGIPCPSQCCHRKRRGWTLVSRAEKMWSESDRKGRLRFWWLEGVAYVKSYVVFVCVFFWGGGHEFEIILIRVVFRLSELCLGDNWTSESMFFLTPNQ